MEKSSDKRVYIPKSLYARLKIEAVKGDRLLRDVIVERIESSYRKPSKDRKASSVA